MQAGRRWGGSGMVNGRPWRLAAFFLGLWWIGWTGIDAARGELESVRSVRVHAEAEESVPIDRAVVEFVLKSEGKTPGEAEEKDQTRFTEVRKRMDTEWAGKGTWRTSEIRLEPVMAEEKGKKEGRERIAGYRVTRAECIELAEFERLGGLLAVLFQAGVDEVTGVSWLSDRLEALYRNLLGKALGKAREKAEVLAKAAGAQLGPALNIQEGAEHPIPVRRFGHIDAAMMVPSSRNPIAAVPISGGEMKINASVQVVYRLW